MTPIVSLILPTFNRAPLLAEAVDSALAQTFEPLEIIVVDDGSTDGTSAVLEKYGSRVRCVHQANRGLSAARNAGLEQAQGMYITFLDDDDVLQSTKIAEQVAILESHDEIGWTYCDVLMHNEASQETITVSERFGYRKRNLDGWLFPELIHGNFIPPMATLIRRTVLARTGGFDPRLRAMEDWDLWLRLSLLAKARYLPRVLATYRIHPGGMSQARALMDNCRSQVLDNISRAHPDAIRRLGTAGRRIVADMHNWYGFAAYARKDWCEARRRLGASVRTLPWQRRALLLLA
ncbi:MAG TPA: glycosyltransferase, partial [Candidatus Acidoferrum sp.]|nr:glycosyltransferase [Candidatus Acidoferrum sp.]